MAPTGRTTMVIDIGKYKINKKYIQDWYFRNKDDKDIGRMIATLACATMCPCIVVAFWVGEASNWRPETIVCIQRLIKFYGYTGVLNKPESSPKEVL